MSLGDGEEPDGRAVQAGATVAQGASTCGFRSRHPRTAQFLPPAGKICLRLAGLRDFRQDTPQIFGKVGAVGLEPTNPLLVSVVPPARG